MKNGRFTAIILIYIALIAIFVLSGLLGWDHLNFTMALPVLFLSVCCFVTGKGRGFWLPLALLFSAAGDFFGAYVMFLPQVGCFALAHICLIMYFLKKAWLRPSLLLFCVLVAAAGVTLGLVIIPDITVALQKWFVIGYIVIICLMCMSAILWSKEYKGWYVAAAIIFMFSDAVIGLTRFGTMEIPYSSIIIMAAYWAAQLIFAGAFMMRFKRNNRRFNPAIMA